VVLTLVLASTTVGCSSETSGSKVDIGGRSLFIDCHGTGSPTVILEGGLTSDTSAWDDVVDQIAGFTRVCAYDRANNGQSDAVGLHGGDQSVRDLDRLLDTRGIEPLYVLVAWSFGGPIARLYAARHSDDVVGMVLVDTDPRTTGASATRWSRTTSASVRTGRARTRRSSISTRRWTSFAPRVPPALSATGRS
jgi:pimeloyl-ACP methyl ester carboxylesterase